MANQSIYNAFERMWSHVVALVGNQSDNMVDLTSEQTVNGVKTFTNGINLGEFASLSYDSTVGAVVITFAEESE